MNAFNGVNLAAACIITSVEYATKLGVPREKWVYITGGAGSNDSSDCKKIPSTFLWQQLTLTLCSLGAIKLLL
jgi:hypothetical protein